jgi:hypothetical protein
LTFPHPGLFWIYGNKDDDDDDDDDCATMWKVTGSNPVEVTGFFNLPNSSSRTMALGWTQPLTEMREMSTRNLSGGLRAAGM